MKSIKPGRGPSMMEGIGAIAGIAFCGIWMVFASRIGAPRIFVLFGLVGIVMLLVNAFYSFHNATAKKRFSSFDIAEDGEENDPLNERFGEKSFCPYCGEKVESDHRFCSNCGKEIGQ